MKKLSKLTLRNVNASDLMSDKEMKDVLGGGVPPYANGCTSSNATTKCSGSCTKSDGKSGTCTVRVSETMCRCL